MEKEKSDLDIEKVLYETLQNLEFLNKTILGSNSIWFTGSDYDYFCSCMDATQCNLNAIEKVIKEKREKNKNG